MATVIRNPVVIQCLREYGITPAEARKSDSVRSIEGTEAWATLAEYLSDYLPEARNSPTPTK